MAEEPRALKSSTTQLAGDQGQAFQLMSNKMRQPKDANSNFPVTVHEVFAIVKRCSFPHATKLTMPLRFMYFMFTIHQEELLSDPIPAGLTAALPECCLTGHVRIAMFKFPKQMSAAAVNQ